MERRIEGRDFDDGVDELGNITDAKRFLSGQINFLQSMDIDPEAIKKIIYTANAEMQNLSNQKQELDASQLCSVIRASLLEAVFFPEDGDGEQGQEVIDEVQESQDQSNAESSNKKELEAQKKRPDKIKEVLLSEQKDQVQKSYNIFLQKQSLDMVEKKILKREFETAIDTLQEESIPLTAQILEWQIEKMREKGIDAYKFRNNEQKRELRQRSSEEAIEKKAALQFKEKYGVELHSQEGRELLEKLKKEARIKMRKRIQNEEQNANEQLLQYMQRAASSGNEEMEKLYIMTKVYDDNGDAISPTLKKKHASFIADISLHGASQAGGNKRHQRIQEGKKRALEMAEELDQVNESGLAKLLRKRDQIQKEKQEKIRQLRIQEAQQKAQWLKGLLWDSSYYSEEIQGNNILRESIRQAAEQKEQEDQQKAPSEQYKKTHGYDEQLQYKTRSLLRAFVQEQQELKKGIRDESALYRPYFFPEEYKANDESDLNEGQEKAA